ncbi:patellin-3-like [Rhodamnia argentea]|uniref:Patellin-3-like n=1 Tax=Rhodamnia argentea TaxID=178133 RepID=A0A8B8P810_9MYRT|nr:patellin-3-like [Rhodamnia argentea]
MAEDPQNTPPASETPAPAEEVVVGVVPYVPQAAETPAAGKEPPPSEAAGEDGHKVPEGELEEKIVKASRFASFKEETNVVGELPEAQKKALDELKRLVREALNKREFTTQPSQPPPKEEEKKEDKEAVKTSADGPSRPEAEAATEVPPPVPVEEAEAVVIIQEVVENVTAVEEDGAKTLEAIKETIVEVSITASAGKTEEAAAPAPAAAIESKKEAEPMAELEEVFIWGVPLLGDDERSDVILLKFLRARDFKVKESFDMIKSTVRWRREFGVDGLLEEDLGTDYNKAVFMRGLDREGHPVCYNVYGEFQDRELHQKAFGGEEKRKKFLKWRIQFLERSIRKLDMSPGGISTVVQVIDLKNSPGLLRRELRKSTGQALQILQDNYPEFVAKQVFINVPWWYLAYNRIISPFLTQRTKSKFVFASPSRTAETLLKYIAPEHLPAQYGGLSTEEEQEFTAAEPATEVAIKPATKHIVEFPVAETCLVVWEAKVVGCDASYGAEFVPSAEGSYTVIVQKTRKITPADEPVICGRFKAGEPGKVVLTIDNQSSKRKTLLYRSKTKACSEDQCPC